jgi:hypothetical protein
MQVPTFTRRGVVLAAAAFLVPGRGHGLASEHLPRMIVTKSPTCGCCSGWVAHIRAAGFPVEIVEAADLQDLKARLGVPAELAACHTAELGGYVIEGHVPAAAVRTLLAERPEATGLAVPGMPVGSPGMEIEGAAPEVYDVILFGPSGQSRFARFRGQQQA